MKDVMMMLLIVTMYAMFLTCVLTAVWYTGSAWCLWALLLVPSVRYKDDE